MAMTAEKWNLSRISVELDVDRRYLAKRIKGVEPCGKSGKSELFWLADIVKALYAPQELNYQVETAKLRKAQTEKTEMAIARERGDLIPADRVQQVWTDMAMAFKAKVIGLPSAVAPLVAGSSVHEVEDLLRARVDEALSELKDYEPGDYATEDNFSGAGSGPDDVATAPVKRKRVGRPRKSPVERSKRGARKVADQ